MSMSLYGGLVLFSLYLLYDTQNVIKKAETMEEFDPILESLNIYMDIINIFIRIVTILSLDEEQKEEKPKERTNPTRKKLNDE
jgi:FtsH-binding integral membrane protein